MSLARPWPVLVVLAALACVSLATQALAAGKRVALVVGIGAYSHLPQLGNTVSDAGLIADKLRATGFDVDLETNLGTEKLKLALRDFGRRIEAAGPDAVALLYYAGHGVQDDKQGNYLIGADADLRSQVDLPLEALSLDAALQTLDAARPATTFVILDACRDDPLPVSDRRGGKRGLAVVSEQRGLLIAYSTEPGKTALDGPAGGHSPFAAALADGLDKPGLEVTQLFKLVTKQVLDETHEEQFPWVTQRLVDDFYFRSGPPPPTKTVAAAVPKPASEPAVRATQPAPADQGDAAEIAYGKAVLENSAPGYEAWLHDFPNDKRKPSVLALLQRLREEELWRRSEAASTSEAVGILQTELMAFPDGVYAERARQRLGALLASPSQPQSADTGAPGPPGPSFNCAKAGTVVERQICASPTLSAQDKLMADRFGRILAKAADPLDLQAQQTDWLHGRDACAARGSAEAISSCVASAYTGRISALRLVEEGGDAAPVGRPPAGPSFNCAAARSPVERLICDVPQLASADRTLAALYAEAARADPGIDHAEAIWMKGRNACGARQVRAEAIACIVAAYRSRISALGGAMPGGTEAAVVAVRPSFDCARAGHPIEKLICAVPKLAQDDRDMAALYTRVRARLPSPTRLDKSQTSWILHRNDCAALLERDDAIRCVDQLYGSRVSELQAE